MVAILLRPRCASCYRLSDDQLASSDGASSGDRVSPATNLFFIVGAYPVYSLSAMKVWLQ